MHAVYTGVAVVLVRGSLPAGKTVVTGVAFVAETPPPILLQALHGAGMCQLDGSGEGQAWIRCILACRDSLVQVSPSRRSTGVPSSCANTVFLNVRAAGQQPPACGVSTTPAALLQALPTVTRIISDQQLGVDPAVDVAVVVIGMVDAVCVMTPPTHR